MNGDEEFLLTEVKDRVSFVSSFQLLFRFISYRTINLGRFKYSWVLICSNVHVLGTNTRGVETYEF